MPLILVPSENGSRTNRRQGRRNEAMADQVYLGRIVAVGRTPAGQAAALYRVSSRSFPNRRAVVEPTAARIVPKEGHEADVHRNPYIAYNCCRIIGPTAVVTNGSHTDPVAEKIAAGMSARDALVYGLAALDYEKDDYDTPRVAAVMNAGAEGGWLGTVRKDGLEVVYLPLAPGRCLHVSTYEHARILPAREADFTAGDAEGACGFVLGEGVFSSFTNPVSAVAAVETDAGGFAIAARDADA
jgi:IMP cyclohydrolase